LWLMDSVTSYMELYFFFRFYFFLPLNSLIYFNGCNVFWQNPFNFALSILNASNKSINQKSMGEYDKWCLVFVLWIRPILIILQIYMRLIRNLRQLNVLHIKPHWTRWLWGKRNISFHFLYILFFFCGYKKVTLEMLT
jgi:hypothetical protein